MGVVTIFWVWLICAAIKFWFVPKGKLEPMGGAVVRDDADEECMIPHTHLKILHIKNLLQGVQMYSTCTSPVV